MAVNKVVFGAVSIMDITDSTVTPGTLAKGVTAYDKSGEKITGTMESLDTSDANATSGDILQNKTAYVNGEKVEGTIPTVEQAIPSISVSSAGLITASATQSGGFVTAGTKSATKQLTAKAAATITPTTTDQTIAAGTYIKGIQTIKGDPNLKAENIAEGVSIFGVTGTHAGGSGAVETCTIIIRNTVLRFYAANINGQSVAVTNPPYTTVYDEMLDWDISVYTIENVVVGSIFIYRGNNNSALSASNSAVRLDSDDSYGIYRIDDDIDIWG